MYLYGGRNLPRAIEGSHVHSVIRHFLQRQSLWALFCQRYGIRVRLVIRFRVKVRYSVGSKV